MSNDQDENVAESKDLDISTIPFFKMELLFLAIWEKIITIIPWDNQRIRGDFQV